MKSFLAFILLLFLSNIISGQENESTNQLNNIGNNNNESIDEVTFENINISKKLFDFSKCPNNNFKKCFKDNVAPSEIFSFIGVSNPKAFQKATYNHTKNFVVSNIDEEIFLAAINNNKIKFEKPYLNFTFWVNQYGKPDIRFFGTNISANKNATEKLKFIISKIFYDKNFHPDFEKVRNQQLTIFIPLGKLETNEGVEYIIEERTKEYKEFYHAKVKNTFPPYFKSCNNLEGSTEYTTVEKKEGINQCMRYQYSRFLKNNADQNTIKKSLQKLKITQNTKKPKFRGFASFKIDEFGKPCEYQAISIFPSMEKEILRLIKKLPISTPATFNGKNVKYKYRIPITFKSR